MSVGVITPGQLQARDGPFGRAHKSRIDRTYKNVYIPTGLENLAYRAILWHKSQPQNIDGVLPQVDWTDSGPVLQGTLGLMRETHTLKKLKIGNADPMRLQVRWHGAWHTLWDMRVWDPDDDIGSGSYTATLYDDLHILEISTDNFRFRRHKTRHPHGWKCHEILIAIAQRYRLPLGKIAVGTYDIKSLEMEDVSPLDAIVRAYRLERQHSGRRFVIRWRGGKLDVVPLQHNPVLYVLQDQIEAAHIQLQTPDAYATALTGRWVTKKKKHHALVTGNLDRGFIHQTVQLHGVDSENEARTRLKHMLAQRQRIKPIIPITHELIPFVQRGNAMQIVIPERGITGDKGLVWVSQGDFHLAGDAGTMDLQFSWDDPLKNPKSAQAAKDKATRDKKRTASK